MRSQLTRFLEYGKRKDELFREYRDDVIFVNDRLATIWYEYQQAMKLGRLSDHFHTACILAIEPTKISDLPAPDFDDGETLPSHLVPLFEGRVVVRLDSDGCGYCRLNRDEVEVQFPLAWFESDSNLLAAAAIQAFAAQYHESLKRQEDEKLATQNAEKAKAQEVRERALLAKLTAKYGPLHESEK